MERHPLDRAIEDIARIETAYRDLGARLGTVAYLMPVDGPLRYIGPGIEDLLGYPVEEWLSRPGFWREVLHMEDRDRVLGHDAAVAVSGEPWSDEYRLVAADGRTVWVRDEALLVPGEGGRPYWHGVFLDITGQKATEQALQESERRYRALVESIPAIVYLAAPDDDRKTLYVSPQVEAILGYTQREWLEQPDIFMELLHPDDREPVLAAHDLHNETGEPWSMEYRLIAADGRVVWFHDEATLLRDDGGRPLFWQGVRLDITRQKRAEEELRTAHRELERRVQERTAELEEANAFLMLEVEERRRLERELRGAEERYRALVEGLPAVVYLWSVNVGEPKECAYTSPRIEQLLGFTVKEWTAPGFWLTRVHPDDLETVLAASRRSEERGEPFDLEYRYLAKDGRVVWVHDVATLLEPHPDGRPGRFQGVMVDITARKHAEAKAREVEERYRALAEQIPAIAYVWEPHGGPHGTPIVTYTSRRVQEILGFEAHEWLPDPSRSLWASRLHPDDRDRVLAAADRAARTGEPFDQRYRLLAKGGDVVWILDRATLLSRDPQGRPAVFHGVMLDVSEQVRAEERIRQAEARYRTLVERIPAITYVEEVEPGRPDRSRLLFISPQVEQVLGYSPRELLDDPSSYARILHPEDRERVLAENRRTNETGDPFALTYRVLAKDGRVVWLQSQAECARDDGGRPRYWHGVAFDVTALREEQEDLARAADGVPLGRDPA